MDTTIEEAKKVIPIFFGGSYGEIEKIFPIVRFFKLHSVYMETLGVIEINKKHGEGGFLSHLIIVNEAEDCMIIFVEKRFGNEKDPKIAMFCFSNGSIYEHRNNTYGIWFSYEQFNGFLGHNMLHIAQKFVQGVSKEDLILSENELARDIVDHIKALANT